MEISHDSGRRGQLINQKKKSSAIEAKRVSYTGNILSYKKEEAKAKRVPRKIKKESFKNSVVLSTNTQVNLTFGKKSENLRTRRIVEHNQINTKKINLEQWNKEFKICVLSG
jgi:hypothetical protein